MICPLVQMLSGENVALPVPEVILCCTAQATACAYGSFADTSLKLAGAASGCPANFHRYIIVFARVA